MGSYTAAEYTASVEHLRAKIAQLEKSRDYWREAAEEWSKWLSVSAEKAAKLEAEKARLIEAGDALCSIVAAELPQAYNEPDAWWQAKQDAKA